MKTRVSLSYFVTYFRFKGSLITNFPSIKELLKNLWQINVLFLYAISYLQFNVTHLIYVIKCFSLNVFIFITTKNNMNFIFYSFFLRIFANFLIWSLHHPVVFTAKLREYKFILVRSFLLLKLFIFIYLSFLKRSLVHEEKNSFHFYKCKGGFGYNSP